MNIQAAIFDMDGTLLDSGPIWRDILQGIPVSFGMDISDDDFIAMYAMTWEDTVTFLEKKYKNAPLQVPLDNVLTSITDAITAAYAVNIQCKPGVPEYLETLRQKGIRMCVATLTPTEYAKTALERVGLAPYFEFVITGDDVGADKRSPDIFLEAARRLETAPADAAVYEDSLIAAKTAHAAGFKVVGVYDPFQVYEFDEILPYTQATIRDYRALRDAVPV